MYGRRDIETLPDMIKRKALDTMVEMDAVLSEAFFAFYWLGNSRKLAIGMGGSVEFMIELTEIIAYHKTFEPAMDLQHFVKVVRSADNEYMKIQSENFKRKQDDANRRKSK